jgi:hypothetical protein
LMGKVVEINRQLRAAEGNDLLAPLPPLPPYSPPPGQAPAAEEALAAAQQQQQQANPMANPLMAGIQATRQQTPILHRVAQASGIRTTTPGRGTPVATSTPLMNCRSFRQRRRRRPRPQQRRQFPWDLGQPRQETVSCIPGQATGRRHRHPWQPWRSLGLKQG